MNYAKLTKAELLGIIARQDDTIVQLGRDIEALRVQVAMRAPVGSANTPGMPRFYKFGREVAPTQRQLEYYASRNSHNLSGEQS